MIHIWMGLFVCYYQTHFVISQLYEGDKCAADNFGHFGKCVTIENCPWALNQIKKYSHPRICEFKGNFPVVCCLGQTQPQKEKEQSTVRKNTPGELSKKKCEEYNKPKNDFHIFVIGGKKSLPNEFPHMAILGFGDQADKQWLCGGSLISESFVLTAAHCLYSQEFGDVKWVRLGDLDIKNTTDDAEPQDFSVIKIISHPQHNPPSHYNDIALLQLNTSAKFTTYVKPACLFTEENLPSEKLVATGWGVTEVLGEPSNHLMKVDLVHVKNVECNKKYQSISKQKLERGIANSQICAGSPNPSEQRDTCQGDSGGPIQVTVYKSTVRYEIVGITSFGKYCGSAPGVYTKVSYYTSWIEDIVWGN